MKRLIIIFAAIFAATTLLAQSRAQRYVDQLAKTPPLQDAVWGVLAKDAKGNVLAEYRSGTLMLPASNMKLITTGTGMLALGADYRFDTSLGYTGEIVDGTLNGDLYIIGGGDPTLCTRDSIAVSMAGIFRTWKRFLQIAGINAINGRIIGDGRLWDVPLEGGSWTRDDIGTYYGPGGSALGFYANAVDFSLQAAKVGETVPMEQTFPETPWMHIANRTKMAPAGTGNSLLLFTTELAPYGEIRGTLAVDKRIRPEHFANKYGALTCAYYFWKELTEGGMRVSGGYADIDRDGLIRTGADFVSHEAAGTPDKVIGTTHSPTLNRIALATNCRSDNYYAESIFRAMGFKATGCAEYDSCYVAVRAVLEELGMPENGINITDGSGLSRKNYVTPEFMVSYLQKMQQTAVWKPFLNSLPYPGGNGTLKHVLKNSPESLRRRIRMKSGSMDGVLCYSGYILPAEGSQEGPITFSILTNNCTAEFIVVREAITKILVLLAQ